MADKFEAKEPERERESKKEYILCSVYIMIVILIEI